MWGIVCCNLGSFVGSQVCFTLTIIICKLNKTSKLHLKLLLFKIKLTWLFIEMTCWSLFLQVGVKMFSVLSKIKLSSGIVTAMVTNFILSFCLDTDVLLLWSLSSYNTQLIGLTWASFPSLIDWSQFRVTLISVEPSNLLSSFLLTLIYYRCDSICLSFLSVWISMRFELSFECDHSPSVARLWD